MESRPVIYLIRKSSIVILTILLVTFLSFLLMRLNPIDPATAYVKRHTAIVTEEQIHDARVKLGLDKPLLLQYFNWLGKAVQMDFGISLATGYPVAEEMKNPVAVTVRIVLLASAIMIVGVLIFGTLHFLCRGGIAGKILTVGAITGISIPPFFLAVVFLNLFSSHFGLMKVAGNAGFFRYFPASFCLSVCGIAFYSRMLFGSLEREMKTDYAFYARCRGLSEYRILSRHALPHAVVDLIPSFAQMMGLTLAGAVIVEKVFSIPGLGDLIIKSVLQRDSPVIHASVLVLAFILVFLDFSASFVQRIIQRGLSGGRSAL